MVIEGALVTMAIFVFSSVIGAVVKFITLETKFSAHKHAELANIPAIDVSIKSIVERLKEDRDSNSSAHEKFYQFIRSTEPAQAGILQQLINIAETQGRILKEIDELRKDRRQGGNSGPQGI